MKSRMRFLNGQTFTTNTSKAWEYPKVISYKWLRVYNTNTAGTGSIYASTTDNWLSIIRVGN